MLKGEAKDIMGACHVYTHFFGSVWRTAGKRVWNLWIHTRGLLFFLGCQRKLGERKTREYSKEKKLAVRNGERIS